MFVNTEAMMAAAGYISREYGAYGYSLGISAVDWLGGGVFTVRHSDGAEFRIFADRWGNVRDLCELKSCMETGAYRPYIGGGSRLCDTHTVPFSLETARQYA